MDRQAGIEFARFEPGEQAWIFLDSFPTFKAFGRVVRPPREGSVSHARHESGVDLAEAHILNRLKNTADIALGSSIGEGGLSKPKLGPHADSVETLESLGEQLQSTSARRDFGTAIEALRQFLAADSSSEIDRAYGKLLDLTGYGRLFAAFERVRDAGYESAERERAQNWASGLFDVLLPDPLAEGVLPAQRSAYEALREDLDAVSRRVLTALVESEPGLLEGHTAAAEGPRGSDAHLAVLKPHVLLAGVYVHRPTSSESCDLGFVFDSWDDEHGHGVRLRTDGELEVGGMDTGFSDS